MLISISGKKSAQKALVAIGEELIKRADDITRDLERVSSISIYALLEPDKRINFDITKNYTATFEAQVEEE